MKLWHNGEVVIWDGVSTYYGGKFDYVDYCDYDKMSIVELNDIVKSKLSYAVGAVYYLKVPGVEDIQFVETDAQLMKLLDRILLITRVVEVYCSHPLNAPLKQVDPPVAWDSLRSRSNHEPTQEDANASQVVDDTVSNPDFRDDDYEQSDEDDVIDDTVEKNLEGLHRREKGKGVDIDLEDGVFVEDSDSNAEEDFGGNVRVQSSDSEADIEEQQAVDVGVTSGQKRSKKVLPRLPEFMPSSDLSNPKFQLGLVFLSGSMFKAAIREYAVKSSKAIYFKVNEAGRVRAACSRQSGECPWVCFASKVSGTQDFMIKTFVDKHTCKRTTSNKFASLKWLARTYAFYFKSRKNWDVKEFINMVKRDHVIDVSLKKAYRARKHAEIVLEGSYSDQYKALWDYAEEIKFTNPGSTVKIKSSLGEHGVPEFVRMYICYAACKEGFKSGCSCNKWDLSGIPCQHAIACIWYNHEDPESYVSDWYKKEAYERTYAHQILPIRRSEDWPASEQTGMNPPAIRRQPGRPKRARRLEHDEVFTTGRTKMRRVYNTNHCKTYGKTGHNARTCPDKQPTSQPAPRGRWKNVSSTSNANPCTSSDQQNHNMESQRLEQNMGVNTQAATNVSPLRSPTRIKTRVGRKIVQMKRKAIATKNTQQGSQSVVHQGTQESQLTQDHQI